MYKAHLKVAQEWGNMWQPILESIQESINTIMDKKYKNLHQKLDNLEKEQTNSPCNPNLTFHPRVANHTNISFSPEEIKLLNKGLKYNLRRPQFEVSLVWKTHVSYWHIMVTKMRY